MRARRTLDVDKTGTAIYIPRPLNDDRFDRSAFCTRYSLRLKSKPVAHVFRLQIHVYSRKSFKLLLFFRSSTSTDSTFFLVRCPPPRRNFFDTTANTYRTWRTRAGSLLSAFFLDIGIDYVYCNIVTDCVHMTSRLRDTRGNRIDFFFYRPSIISEDNLHLIFVIIESFLNINVQLRVIYFDTLLRLNSNHDEVTRTFQNDNYNCTFDQAKRDKT